MEVQLYMRPDGTIVLVNQDYSMPESLDATFLGTAMLMFKREDEQWPMGPKVEKPEGGIPA